MRLVYPAIAVAVFARRVGLVVTISGLRFATAVVFIAGPALVIALASATCVVISATFVILDGSAFRCGVGAGC